VRDSEKRVKRWKNEDKMALGEDEHISGLIPRHRGYDTRNSEIPGNRKIREAYDQGWEAAIDKISPLHSTGKPRTPHCSIES